MPRCAGVVLADTDTFTCPVLSDVDSGLANVFPGQSTGVSGLVELIRGDFDRVGLFWMVEKSKIITGLF